MTKNKICQKYLEMMVWYPSCGQMIQSFLFRTTFSVRCLSCSPLFHFITDLVHTQSLEISHSDRQHAFSRSYREENEHEWMNPLASFRRILFVGSLVEIQLHPLAFSFFFPCKSAHLPCLHDTVCHISWFFCFSPHFSVIFSRWQRGLRGGYYLLSLSPFTICSAVQAPLF